MEKSYNALFNNCFIRIHLAIDYATDSMHQMSFGQANVEALK